MTVNYSPPKIATDLINMLVETGRNGISEPGWKIIRIAILRPSHTFTYQPGSNCITAALECNGAYLRIDRNSPDSVPFHRFSLTSDTEVFVTERDSKNPGAIRLRSLRHSLGIDPEPISDYTYPHGQDI